MKIDQEHPPWYSIDTILIFRVCIGNLLGGRRFVMMRIVCLRSVQVALLAAGLVSMGFIGLSVADSSISSGES